MRAFFLYGFILFDIVIAYGQNQRFKTLSLKEGLSQSTVNCIIQDQLGLLWIGTQDGLNRYDGKEFVHYKKNELDSNSIPDNNVQSLYEDSKGNIWIGTYGGGVSLFNPKTNQFIRLNTLNSHLSDDIIMCFNELDNLIYIGTKRGGLNVFNYEDKSLKTVQIDNNSIIQIRDIAIFKDKIYVATSLGGIHYFDQKIWIKLLDTIQIQTIQSFENKIWFGGVNGELFYKEKNSLKTNKILIKGIDEKGIWGISFDKLGNIYLGTFGAGLIKLNPKKSFGITIYKNKKDDFNSLSHDVVLSVFRDSKGGQWVGTLGGGLNYFEPDNQRFKHYNDLTGLSNNVVMSFLEVNEYLYIGTYGGGLNIMDLKKNQITKIVEVKAQIVRCIYKDRTGIIWLGTYGQGLLKYDPKSKKVNRVLKNIIDDVWCITEGEQQEIWIGTWGSGLLRYNYVKNSYTQYLKNEQINSVSDNTILSIAKTKEGNLWIGTYGGGLNFMDVKAKQFKNYGFEAKNNIETNNKKIRCVKIDDLQNLWIGTDGGGINYFDSKNGNFKYITTQNNLPNNVIYGIIQDDQKNIWVTSNLGLSRLSSHNQSITNFDYDDGLQDNEFNQGAIYLGLRSIYAGGINGFNIFNYNKIDVSISDSKTIISSMNLMGKEYNPPIRYIDTLNLNYANNFLSFQFSYLDYSGKVVYRCQLVGLDKNWIYLNDRNYINYTNLTPGKYVLKYQGKRMGDWSENFSTLHIIIPPPFWKTTWFFVTVILFLIFSLYVIYIVKQRNLKRINFELETQVKARTQEIQIKNAILEVQKNDLEFQKELVETKHAEIQSSITYAKRIQNAILPSPKIVKEYLNDAFILYKPKDIVAGDFYWIESISSHGQNNLVLFAAADCTGHGVPGAMVSVVCNNGLNRSVKEYGLTDPGKILDKTREIIISEFEKSEELVRDGMDIALCVLDGNNLCYAGAQNPLWIIKNGADEVFEIKADKQPIGRHAINKPFTTHTLQVHRGDTIYIFSDGFYDQFGGENGKKLKTANFKNLLLTIKLEDLNVQKRLLNEFFEKWKGDLEQIDDVCVIGVRI